MISLGSVVILRSGGPAMTVTEVRDDAVVTCRWFADAELREDVFVLLELIHVMPAAYGGEP